MDKLLDRCTVEPRIAVICSLISVLAKVNRDRALWLSENLGNGVDSLTIKLFLEKRLGFFAVDLYRLHNPLLPLELSEHSTTAQKMVQTRAFDLEELALRISKETSNLKVAILLYNLVIIDRGKAVQLLKKIDFDTWLAHRQLSLEPATIALLFAVRAASEKHARSFVRFLDKQMFNQFIKDEKDPLLLAWAVRELAQVDLSEEEMNHFWDSVPWSSLTDYLKTAWLQQQLQMWEIGWCLWAISEKPSVRRLSTQVQSAILQALYRDVQKEIQLIENPLHQAFAVVGFGIEFARTDRQKWIELARGLRANLPELPGRLLIRGDEDDNSVYMIAAQLGFSSPLDETDAPMPDKDKAVLDHLVWTLCWRWFRLGVFELWEN